MALSLLLLSNGMASSLAASLKDAITTPEIPVVTPENTADFQGELGLLPGAHRQVPATIGERIRQRRKEFGIPPAVLADMVGVSRKAITTWEFGHSDPSSKHIIPLAIALQCEPMWLLVGDALAPIADYQLVDDVNPAQHDSKPEICDIPVKVMNGVDVSRIGERIEKRRVELHISHRQLAAKIGVDKSTEFCWSVGKKIPNPKEIDAIAAALNCRVSWLLTGRGEVEVVRHA
ncbi:helix-turn-helix domain-containing protein [Salmonella enterica]|nr:helix-turn-helix domain-containing protein [Salmonella enterica]